MNISIFLLHHNIKMKKKCNNRRFYQRALRICRLKFLKDELDYIKENFPQL